MLNAGRLTSLARSKRPWKRGRTGCHTSAGDRVLTSYLVHRDGGETEEQGKTTVDPSSYHTKLRLHDDRKGEGRAAGNGMDDGSRHPHGPSGVHYCQPSSTSKSSTGTKRGQDQGYGEATGVTSGFKPCPPEKFRGKRNSLAVSKWLRDMEQYLDLQRVGKRHWVRIAASFLADDADAWFLAESAREEFTSWKDFKAAFEEYFIPQNESFKLRDEWRGLKQEGPLSEYIRKYKRLMLQITEMHDLNRLHGFLYGCSVWTRREIEKQSPNTWEEAIVMAERYQDAESNRRAQSLRKTENTSPRRNKQGAGNANSNARPANTTQNMGNTPGQRNQNTYGNNQQRALPAPQWQRNDPWPFCRTCRGNHWTHNVLAIIIKHGYKRLK
ncbi:hypothetical protein KP509_12G082600 [Ceratopteris richardii]|uniref:Retrotransposon gag domain-containing protein n=1 Tax=Ceratopteris richardii TaxID=49495 RepID=A0A8T2TTX6_CERRI|nr:hypothetical protein KP509_12G082600 [Ceratopteris richardii]